MHLSRVDLLVVGGGINGAGIARDAARRGLSVLLCEKDDLAQHTSSASTKLIHGGLRYLEYYEFGLVRKALQEREVLLRAAPHIIGPLRFVMPHDPGQRPQWMIRAGLFLYDHLAQRELLPASEKINLLRHVAGKPLQAAFRTGFAYSDGWVQDARLVVLNALDAREHGAEIRTRTALLSARRQGDRWHCILRSADGSSRQVEARALVNAAGPWVEQLLHQIDRGQASGNGKSIRLVKGSHIIVRKLFDHSFAYIFQNPDGRILFAIPFEQDFTLIGTTDVEYHGDPGAVKIEAGEIDYLCNMCNRYFAKSIHAEDVVATFSGVRPLLDDDNASAASVTRDYSLELAHEDGAPLLSVFGGKITTYRVLAQQAVDKLAPLLGVTKPTWTHHTPLPGGDIPNADFSAFLRQCLQRYATLPENLVTRYARAYGTRIHRLLEGVRRIDDLDTEILPGLYEREARYLIEQEFACSAEDILSRRTRLKLRVSEGDARRLERWLENLNPVFTVA